MKSAKILICIALSFSFLLVGVGFAQVTASLDFTGNVSFQHTGLYISNITSVNGVNITGYSGTMLNLTAEAGATMTITVTNPLGDTYYYLDYSAGDYKLTTSIENGDPVAPGGSITFTVTLPEIDHDHIVRFNFTLVPPSLEEPGTGGENTSNATGVVHLVIGEKSKDEKIGLNSSNTSKTFEQWCSSTNPILHCKDKTVQGNNLTNLFATLEAQDVYFTLEWVSNTKYNLYLYSANDATKNNTGKYIVTYRQEILYNTDEDLWYAADSFKGYAKVIEVKKEYGIEFENNKVKWYAELPSGAELVGN